MKRNTIPVLAGLLGAFYLSIAVMAPLTVEDWASTAGEATYGVLVGVGGLLVFAGLLTARRLPRLAPFVLSGGAVLGAAMTFWLVVTPFVTLLILIWLIAGRQRRRPATA